MEDTSQKHQQAQGIQSFLNLRRGYIEKCSQKWLSPYKH